MKAKGLSLFIIKSFTEAYGPIGGLCSSTLLLINLVITLKYAKFHSHAYN
jgi:hypothetical protein